MKPFDHTFREKYSISQSSVFQGTIVFMLFNYTVKPSTHMILQTKQQTIK